MMLTEALAALHAAGRIQAPWPSGMRVLLPIGNGIPDRAGRIVAANRRGIQLLEWEAVTDRRTWGAADIPRHWRPDLEDAATRGCLLALLREATHCSTVHVAPNVVVGWAVWRSCSTGNGWERLHGEGRTEGEALTAALVALAIRLESEGACPPTEQCP